MAVVFLNVITTTSNNLGIFQISLNILCNVYLIL